MCTYCSPIKKEKTIQDVTKEIINILSLHEYPEIPFIINNLNIQLKTFERLQADIFYLQDSIDWWYLERKFEEWTMVNPNFSRSILVALKSVKIRKRSLFGRFEDLTLSQEYYNNVLSSYIKKMKRLHKILLEWVNFLDTIELQLYKKTKIKC